MRYALVLEYDGSHFHGWQRQPDAPSVQQCVEQALSLVADTPVITTCAGRTDAGVHATAQVVHFDTDITRTAKAWLRGCNSHLPDTIRVRWAGEVGEGFHARYSALQRTYRYRILQGGSASARRSVHSWWLPNNLDIAAMREAAAALPGEHDFSAFRAVSCQARSAHRFVSSVSLGATGELLSITISANAFLHNMVRIIVGSLVAVGRAEHEPSWIAELLRGRDRTRAAVTAPARGLCLVGVRYAQPHRLPSERCQAG